MRKLTFEIGKYRRGEDGLPMFSEIWARQYLLTHAYFTKDGKPLWTDMLFAVQGFFLYYQEFVCSYIPDYKEVRELIEDDILLGMNRTTLVCQVPFQKRVRKIEDEIYAYVRSLRDLQIETRNEGAIACSNALRKSITSAKVKRLFRWGYKEAKALIPNSMENVKTLTSFFEEFNKVPDSDYLNPVFQTLEFEIEDGANLKWDLLLVKSDGTRVHYKDIDQHLQ